ncbi:type ISP restriction/modification enzyme [Streptomyces liangshanensis]|uniref:type ISP restriction/modification enzyme n=1 Tax=Streptomyces liangshanensis TaxID=2717324 RepID=UPI0036DAB67D
MASTRAGGNGDRVPPGAPLLSDLMPWSAAPLRFGRSWVLAPDAASLTARWDRLVRAEGAEREALFGPTRSRTPHSAVPALPGQAAGTGRFAREPGRCPEPLRVFHGPFDEQWLIPDHRLIDAARPELWRVAGARQVFAVEQGYVPGAAGPALLVSALLPDGAPAAGRSGRIRPLYRRPGGLEPNVTPGLTALLSARHGREVAPEEVLAWAVAVAVPGPRGPVVPLTADPGVWAAGVELGRLMTAIQLRGAHGGVRHRLPGGRRPYVRAAIPDHPGPVAYDPAEETLSLGAGRVAPVPAGAWDFTVSGVRVLERWAERRAGLPEGVAPGSLAAIRPPGWRREWTSELLDLITVLALLAGLDPRRERLLTGEPPGGPTLTRDDLYAAGVLPVPAGARRPASVLDHHEEGPEGQFALI